MIDRPTRPRRDFGFTLVELVVVVVLMGLVTTSIAFAAMVMLRTAPGTNDRIETAAAQRSLTQWLSRDLASVPGFEMFSRFDLGLDETPGPGPGRCHESPGGASLLMLRWRVEDSERVVTFAVDYRLVDQTITRTSCSSDPATDTSTLALHGAFTSAVVVTAAGREPGSVEMVTLNAVVDPDPNRTDDELVALAVRLSPRGAR